MVGGFSLLVTRLMWRMTYNMWHATFDMLHVTCYMWHVTCDTWHVTCECDMSHVTDENWYVTCVVWCLWFVLIFLKKFLSLIQVQLWQMYLRSSEILQQFKLFSLFFIASFFGSNLKKKTFFLMVNQQILATKKYIFFGKFSFLSSKIF